MSGPRSDHASLDAALAALPSIGQTVASSELAARKSLGQHFLFDLNLTRRIARAAQPFDGRTIIEIGPGPGGLTRALLLERADPLVAVERDARCITALAPLVAAAAGRLNLIEGDALEIDVSSLGAAPRLIVANLPYNVATPLILSWLERPGLIERAVVMVQKEVAERLVARPGDEAYGRLSVRIHWVAEAEILFDVSPRAFVPPPKVVSSVIRLTPRAVPLCAAPVDAFEAVLRAAFGQRRKMLRAALKSLGVDPLALLSAAGIAPTARAETLSTEAFCALARALAETPGRPPIGSPRKSVATTDHRG